MHGSCHLAHPFHISLVCLEKSFKVNESLVKLADVAGLENVYVPPGIFFKATFVTDAELSCCCLIVYI
jgi:hypothetical protein